ILRERCALGLYARGRPRTDGSIGARAAAFLAPDLREKSPWTDAQIQPAALVLPDGAPRVRFERLHIGLGKHQSIPNAISRGDLAEINRKRQSECRWSKELANQSLSECSSCAQEISAVLRWRRACSGAASRTLGSPTRSKSPRQAPMTTTLERRRRSGRGKRRPGAATISASCWPGRSFDGISANTTTCLRWTKSTCASSL